MRLRPALIAAFAVLVPLSASGHILLKESGSTLLFPVMNAWVAAYVKIAPDVDVSTEATGSGAGIAAAENGTAHVGASDAYLNDATEARGDLVQIPLAVAGQIVAYNVADAGDLSFSADVLAAIYSGKITTWNDRRIAALNPRARLPAARIVPLRRSDRSGDTFLFTSFLSAAASTAWPIAPATSIAWPDVAGEESAKGNRELLDLLHNTQNAIAYIGISLYAQAEADGLGVAAIRNRDGAYVHPTKAAIEEAAARMGRVPRDLRIVLIDLGGARTYPIVNIEYAVVKKKQAEPGTLGALRAFLGWVVDPAGGNARAMLDPVHFVPLPDAVRARSREEIAALH